MIDSVGWKAAIGFEEQCVWVSGQKHKNFWAFRQFRFFQVYNVTNSSHSKIIDWCSTFTTVLSKISCAKFNLFFEKIEVDHQEKSNKNATFRNFCQFQVAGKQTQQLTCAYFHQVMLNTLIPGWKKCSQWFSRGAKLFFKRKRLTSKLWHFQTNEENFFSQNFNIGRCSTDEELLIRTIRVKILEVVLKEIDYVYQDESN